MCSFMYRYNYACAIAHAAASGGVAPSEQSAAHHEVLQILRRLLSNGGTTLQQLGEDPDFAYLRSQQCFKTLGIDAAAGLDMQT